MSKFLTQNQLNSSKIFVCYITIRPKSERISVRNLIQNLTKTVINPKLQRKSEMKAFVLLGAQPNTEEKVYNKLKKFSEVKQIHLLFGSWDIIAMVEMKSVAALNEFMLEKVRKINEVTLTATMIIAK